MFSSTENRADLENTRASSRSVRHRDFAENKVVVEHGVIRRRHGSDPLACSTRPISDDIGRQRRHHQSPKKGPFQD